MLKIYRLRSSVALVAALGLVTGGVLPGLMSAPAIAQQPELFQRRVIVPAGTVIQTRYDEAKKIVLMPDETVPVTLTVARDVKSSSGSVLIARGSEIKGELQPTDGGSQFVAEELILRNGQSFEIDATSDVVTNTETIRKGKDTGAILRDAAIGAAAAAILAELTGGIDIEEVLGGAGAGALASILLGGSRREVEVVVVEPDQDLDVTLQSSLRLR